MPSSWSSSLRFELQFTGENINLWGDKLDATLSRVDDAIAGYVAVPISGAPGAIAFSDGDRSVANARVFRRALAYAATFDALVLSHAEDPELVKGASATEAWPAPQPTSRSRAPAGNPSSATQRRAAARRAR